MSPFTELLEIIRQQPFCISDFAGYKSLHNGHKCKTGNGIIVHNGDYEKDPNHFYEYPETILRRLIIHLNKNRELFLKTGEQAYLQQILVLLPWSFHPSNKPIIFEKEGTDNDDKSGTDRQSS